MNTRVRNSPEINSRIDIGADRMSGSAVKSMRRRGDKEMGRTIAMPVFSPSPCLPIIFESSRRTLKSSQLRNENLFRDCS